MIEFDKDFKILWLRGDFAEDDLEKLTPFTEITDVLDLENFRPQFQPRGRISIPNIRYLSVAKTDVDPNTFFALRNPVHIVFVDSELSTNQYLRSANICSVESFGVRKQKLDDDVTHWIQESRISSLSITDTDADDSTLKGICDKSGLISLSLFRNEFTFHPSDWADVKFPKVRYLDVSGTQVTDESLQTIATSFPSLVQLIAKEANISRSAVEQFRHQAGSLKILSTDYEDLDLGKGLPMFYWQNPDCEFHGSHE